MYPDPFTYERAQDIGEAVQLLAKHDSDSTELLAGGHSLLPTMKTRLASPDVVIDISRIDSLHGIEANDSSVMIGSLTPYAEIANSNVVRSNCRTIAEAADAIGDLQVRNMGTIGGNIAHADPASDLPASVLATDATIHVRSPDGSRTIPAADFFGGLFSTALSEEELITQIEVPSNNMNGTSTYVKRPSPSSGYALVGVAAGIETDGPTVTSTRIAVTGATDCPVRLAQVESALTGSELSADAISEASTHATDDIDEVNLMDDDQASSEYRAQLLEKYTERALDQAMELT